MEEVLEKQNKETKIKGNYKVKEGSKACEIRVKTGLDCTQSSCDLKDMTRVWSSNGDLLSLKFMDHSHITATIKKIRDTPGFFCCGSLKTAWLDAFYDELRRRRRVGALLFAYVSRNSKDAEFFKEMQEEEYKAQSQSLTKKLSQDFNKDLKSQFNKKS